MASNILCDVCIVGDTPFSATVQDSLRELGLTTFLVYTGDPDVRYIYIEDIDIPHILCRYGLRGVDQLHRLRYAQYSRMFRERLGGDVWFFYSLLRCIDDGFVDLKLSWVGEASILKSRGCVSKIEGLSLLNRFVRTESGVLVEYGSLVWVSSLRSLSQILDDRVTFVGLPLGLNIEESVSVLPPEIVVGPLGHSDPNVPIVSYTRGFLKYHVLPHDSTSDSVRIEDYVKIPGSDTEDYVRYLESYCVQCVGPRALWNSSLGFESELRGLKERIKI